MFKRIFKNLVYRIRGEYTIEQLQGLGLVVGKNFNPQVGFELDPSHCWLIEIGDDVTFGPHVHVLAHDASTCSFLGYAKIGKVKIGNNVFIGDSSIVLPNVTIGNNVVVGAGSVVTHSIPDNSVCAGNPAIVISTLEEFKSKNKRLMDSTYCPVYEEDYTLRGGIDLEKKKQQIRELQNTVGFVK